MEQKRRICSAFLILGLLIASGCTKPELNAPKHNEYAEVKVTFGNGNFSVRAIEPDEELVKDISIMVFDENGDAEECLWLKDSGGGCSINLVKGRKYTFCACVNFGYEVRVRHIKELDGLYYYMAYPDEYREGIPMYAIQEDILVAGNAEIRLELIRLMSKINIRMDRNRLSDGVEMQVRAVRIGNCPKSVKIFGESKVSGKDDCFVLGFSRDEMETQALNRNSPETGISREISLYMLENMQGNFYKEINESRDKIFDANDYRSETCSYIEMEIEYLSGKYKSTEKPLIYRFYLGGGTANLDVERNCLYTITVCPEDDGLSDSGWRVDKSGLKPSAEPAFKAFPSSYIQGNIGDRIHIWCEVTPEDVPFDVGENYMEDDEERGIYKYTIDDDGHGAVLELTKAGTGLIYMEAGPPVNESALFIIEVNLPASKAPQAEENPTSENQRNGDSGQQVIKCSGPYTTLCMRTDFPVCRQTQDFRHRPRLPAQGQSPSPPT